MLKLSSADLAFAFCSTRSHNQRHRSKIVSCIVRSPYLYPKLLSTATSRVAVNSTLITMSQPQGRSIVPDHAEQRSNEPSMEDISRQQADFPKVENELNISRFSFLERGIIDRATGLLGSRNPFGKKSKAKEHEVWLFDNTAYKQPSPSTDAAQWEAEFVACFFQNGRKDVGKYVSHIADAIGIDGEIGLDDEVSKLIAERVQPFVSAIAPARTIEISIPSNAGAPHRHTLGPSDNNGIISQIILTGGDASADGTTLTSTNADSSYPTCSGKTRFAGPEGWAVISDIDDTIKVTQSSNPVGILRTTFAEEPRTTEGMEHFYRALDQQFKNPAWFYLSASPYNLYPFLHKFINQYYLPGTIVLRDASWMFFGGLLQSLTQGVQEYKTDRMEKIHSWLPKRKIICIGDSTQRDPESYAQIYKKYPDWIKAIYIRKVIDVPFMETKNQDKRFEDAFKDVPAHVWKIFVTPNELSDHVKHLTGEAHQGVAGALQGF